MKKHIFKSMVVLAVVTLVFVTPAQSQAKGKGNNNGSGNSGGSNSNGSQFRRSTGGSTTFKKPTTISNPNLQTLKGSPTFKKPNLGKVGQLVGNPTKLDPKVVKPLVPVGPLNPPVGPIGPIGPVKPPVGPINPPIGPIGPIGPVKPPKPPKTPPIICPPKHCPGYTFPNWCLRPTFCHWWWNYCPGIQYGYVDCSYDYVTSVVVVDGSEIAVRYWLGVKGMVLPGKGFGVESVDAGSPAEAAGIRPGMVIVAANGIQITDDTAMQQAINTSPNGVLALTLLDKADGQTLSVTVQMKRIVVSGY
jgi:hypothetical protein